MRGVSQAAEGPEGAASTIDVSGARTFQAARKLIKAELERKALLSTLEALVLPLCPSASKRSVEGLLVWMQLAGDACMLLASEPIQGGARLADRFVQVVQARQG